MREKQAITVNGPLAGRTIIKIKLTYQGFAPRNHAVQHKILYICTVFFMVLDLRLAMKIGRP